MVNHTSARQREQTPLATNNLTNSTKNKALNLSGSAKPIKSRTLNLNGTSKKTISRSTKSKTRNFDGTAKTTISNALKRRARSLIKDKSIDAQSRAIIRYGLAANDPLLTELVRRVDAGEPIFDKAGRLIIKTSA